VLHIGILASHSGSNMESILASCRERLIDGRVVAVVCNNRTAKAVDIAKGYGVPVAILNDTTHPDRESLDLAISAFFIEHNVDVVAMAGYMKYRGKAFLKALKGRVMNIHPALLPKYGGKDMYGIRVHEAVLKAGEKKSGATVHWVNDVYDDGQIIRQSEVDVLMDDTASTLSQRVLDIEHKLYIEVLRDLAMGLIEYPIYKE